MRPTDMSDTYPPKGCCKEWDWFVETTGLSHGDPVRIVVSGEELTGRINFYHTGPGFFHTEIYFNVPGEKGVKGYSFKGRKYSHCEEAYDENTERWHPFGVMFQYPKIHRIEAVYDARGKRYDGNEFLLARKRRELANVVSELAFLPDREADLRGRKKSLEEEISEMGGNG